MSNTNQLSTACKDAEELADTYEMLAQGDADGGDREGAKMNMEIARTIRQLRTALIDANDLCRSANEIASRKGAQTNWVAFRKRISASLKRQHKIMYPKANA